jgi:pimeloyl-ACP methyl ester carboxylesterase
MTGRECPGRRFPVGYHTLHPDVALNFQLNRFWNWVGEDRMLAQLRAAAPRIGSYDDWTRELLALGDQALAEARPLPAAYLFRMAEFFIPADDPRKRPLRQRFIDLVRREHHVGDQAHELIPYQHGVLSAYRFTPDRPTGRIIVFGGFDSYIEEWFPFGLALRDHGLDVIAFDGPGQGAALESGVPMTAEWQRPVAAVLDHFALDDVALMGFSLGGGLVMHAAAHEPRVRRVIAQDILSDFTECYARPLGRLRGGFVTHATQIPSRLVNAVIGAARRRDMLADWGVREGMRAGRREPGRAPRGDARAADGHRLPAGRAGRAADGRSCGPLCPAVAARRPDRHPDPRAVDQRASVHGS